MNLLSTDYQLVMSILSKNMTEGAIERVVIKKPDIGKLLLLSLLFKFQYYDLFWNSSLWLVFLDHHIDSFSIQLKEAF